MKTGPYPHLRRLRLIAAAGVLAVVMTACTGRGGGQLPPDDKFAGAASLGFDFSCEDSGGLNPPTGRLRIQLSYAEKGTNPLGAAFSIHGIVDKLDPVLESALCIGQNPPPGGNKLIFLGRYWVTSPTSAGSLSGCPTRQTTSTPMCRFEVIVRDNDASRGPSRGDYFQITLSNGTVLGSELEAGTPVYTRGGVLSSGNLTVD